MATEKRLIDANELIEALPIVTEDRKITLYGAVADFMIMISAMPTVDAVEVVRCADCKYWCEDTLSCTIGNHYDDNWYAEDFCSYGERKDNG